MSRSVVYLVLATGLALAVGPNAPPATPQPDRRSPVATHAPEPPSELAETVRFLSQFPPDEETIDRLARVELSPGIRRSPTDLDDPLPAGAKMRFGRDASADAPLLHVAVSPDGRTTATVSCSGTVELWATSTGRPKGRLCDGSEGISSLAFAPGGKVLAIGGRGAPHFEKAEDQPGRVQLWELGTGTELRTFGTDSRATGIAYAPDGKVLASGGMDGKIRLWDALTGRELRCFGQHRRGVCAVAFAPDGKTLASAEVGGPFHIWDSATGKHLGGGTVPEEWWVSFLDFAPDGKKLVIGGLRAARLWDVAGGRFLEQRFERPVHLGGRFVAFSPDGRSLAAVGREGVVLWETATNLERFHCESAQLPLGRLTCLGFAPDGKTLIAGNMRGTALAWDISGAGSLDRPFPSRRGVLDLFAPGVSR